MNIIFEDLNYTVPNHNKDKLILKNINGIFKSGHLSAILGASGSGKSTLLNILSGYITKNVSGFIYINGKQTNLKYLHKYSKYIMQESSVLPYLTVYESLVFAINLKLGNSISNDGKLKVITNSLESLRLNNVRKTLTNKLSTGEKKRLLIALELIGDPLVIFLDEPVSGLDDQNSYQCLTLLKSLAGNGRTIILSIHAPSAKLFALFDHTYVMSEGQCIYQGLGTYILPFLQQINLICPLICSPIEFLIEISLSEQLKKLTNLTENGKLSNLEDNQTENISSYKFINNEIINNSNKIRTNFCTQCSTLLRRSFIQSLRNKSVQKSRLTMVILIISVFTLFFYNFGNDATKILGNINFLFLTLVAFLYSTMIPTLMNYAFEIREVRPEYFNKWYNLSSYFVVSCLQTLPFMIFYAGLYVLIAYPLTKQPIVCEKFFLFFLICLLVSMVSEAIGQVITSYFDAVVMSLFLGVGVLSVTSIFAIQSYGHDILLFPIFYQYLIKTSYVRYAFEGIVNVVYKNRGKIYCPEDALFCPIRTSKQVLVQFGFRNSDLLTSIFILIVFYIFFKIFLFYSLRRCLRKNSI